MATGWLFTSGSWYYLDPQSGVMAISWLDSSTWYYLGGSGTQMATGWQHLGSNWCLHIGAVMATGWRLNLGGTWYYLTGSGRDVAVAGSGGGGRPGMPPPLGRAVMSRQAA